MESKPTDLPNWEEFLDTEYTVEHRHAGFQTFKGLSRAKALAVLELAFKRGVVGRSIVNPAQSKWVSWEICNTQASRSSPAAVDSETARRLIVDFWDCAQEVLKQR